MTHPLPILRVHHVEMIVGNARLAAFFCRKALGMDLVAYRGPETGTPGSASYALARGELRLVLTSPLTHEDPRVTYLSLHGDSVKDVAFEVEDLDGVCEILEKRRATFVVPPRTLSDAAGSVRIATIKAFGESVHTFVARGGYDGPFLPGYETRKRAGADFGITRLDHFAMNVEGQQLQRWTDFYAEVLGLYPHEAWAGQEVQTARSGLHSRIVSDPAGKVRISINEPAPASGRSQVQEFLDYHLTAGVQHLAFDTVDIVASATLMKENGIEFLPVPAGYYDRVAGEIGAGGLNRQVLEPLNILVDRDEKGILLQAWTRPVGDRPTLFLELIERRGAETFGGTSFKTLFEALESEQARRGNL